MLRFGIIGTNFISEWFAAACRETGGRAEPVAVYSRDLGRGRAFADANGVGTAHDDLDALIEAVDAVYVASPNAAHHPQAMRAIEAGRHVLVEKVIGVSSAQVEEIVAAARARAWSPWRRCAMCTPRRMPWSGQPSPGSAPSGTPDSRSCSTRRATTGSGRESS